MEPKNKQALFLALGWFLLGGLAYVMVGGIALLGAMGGVTPPSAEYGAVQLFALCGLPFPMLFGWVPSALRLRRGRPGAWISAGIMAAVAIVLPILTFVFLVNMR